MAQNTNPPILNKKPQPNRTTIDIGSNFFILNWFYLWTFRLIHHARYSLKYLRLRLPENITAKFNGHNISQAWALLCKQYGIQNVTVLQALSHIYMQHYFLIGMWKIVWGVFTWLGAWYFVKVFVTYVEQQLPYNDGIFWSVAQFLSSLFSSIAIHQLFGQCAMEGIRIKSALTVLIYRKTLKLARVRGGAGEVINIVSTDISRVQDAMLNFHYLWTSALETVTILILAFIEIGHSAWVAVGVIVLLMPVQAYLGLLTANMQRENTELTANRVHVMSELLTAIKLIKFYTWEREFNKKVNDIRSKEERLILFSFRVKAINFAMVFATPVVVATLALATYRFSGNVLTSALSFTILSVFNTLRYPLLMLPQSVKSFAGAWVSLARLTTFMQLPEIEPISLEQAPANQQDVAFELKNASFAWEGDSANTIHDLNLTVKKGEIVAVIGDVGAGKSSLVAALLGQMKKTNGDIHMYGSTSYVPQEAWLLNFTLKENILFGSEFDQAKFDEAIRVCALTRDLTLLASAEYTEIAERGANLSGGQRQRTSLARAVYADKDIVLLDDPLSAVDQAVGRHIFQECLKTHLKGRTVIFVTHQLQYLPEVDKIIQIQKGKITKAGTYTELMQQYPEFEKLINSHVAAGEEGDDDVEAMPFAPTDTQNTISVNVAGSSSHAANAIQSIELNQLTVQSMKNVLVNEHTISSMIERNQLSVIKGGNQHSHNLADIIQRNQSTIHSIRDFNTQPVALVDDHHDEDSAEDKKMLKGKLTTEDTSAEAIGWEDYNTYAKSGNGVSWAVFTIIFFFIVHCIRIGSDYWLRLWIPNTLQLSDNVSDAVYIGTYAGFVTLFTLGVLLRGLLFAREAAKKAVELHTNMFNRILRAPMSFFDQTPLGRILSAFAKHQFHIDETMPDSALQALQYVPLTMGAFILVAVVVPYNWAPIIGLLIVAFIALVWVTPAENHLKASEAATKPPLFSHLGATLEGLFSIRAYNAQNRFDGINMDKLDENHAQFLGMQMVKSWTAFYLDVITCFVILLTSLFMVFFLDMLGDTPRVRASNAGLVISNALQILVFLQWSIRMIGEVQAQISSVGIVNFYSNVKQEAPDEVPEHKPSGDWPSKGYVKFTDVSLKYHEFGVSVLKNVNLDIYPQEKIGIVGRTGSGKSTLLVALLRIVELSGGQITIDGVDVSKIGLRDLREQLAIIPQEPVLFVGTVRDNLDPFNKSSDEEVWRALKAVHLSDAIMAMPLKLESPVIENGMNFSLGQRQLFCIARAILSKTKILVLDEATAAIDMQTDELIQTTIKENFSQLTVLTIAHRLNTIITSDRVLVMDAGQAVEFDSPIQLLDKHNGHFASLVANTGEATAAKLRSVAIECAEERKLKNSTTVDGGATSANVGPADPQDPSLNIGST